MFYCFDFRRLVFLLGLLSFVPVLAWPQGTYTTNFPLTENPISEGGRWINGKATGIDWTNVRTIPGKAFGTELNTSQNADDSIAILNGSWGTEQSATGTVYRTVNYSGSEVELLLRFSISAHNAHGYEFNCSTGYQAIVKWNGPLNNYTELASEFNKGCFSGDILKATAVTVGKSVQLTAYINGVQVNQITDNSSPWTGGSPGIGFYNGNGGDPNNSDFGFSAYSVTDGQGLAPPTDLVAVPH